MKRRPLIISLLILSGVVKAHSSTNQLIKDPLYNYCHEMRKAPDSWRIYVFEGKFTSDGGNTIFITDSTAELGPTSNSWSVYYPHGNLGYYLKNDGVLSCPVGGPSYIGYVKEFKKYGILIAIRSGISFQYLDNGHIKQGELCKSGKAYLRDYDGDNPNYQGVHQEERQQVYPKYFNPANRPKVTQYTLAQLYKKYPALKRSDLARCSVGSCN